MTDTVGPPADAAGSAGNGAPPPSKGPPTIQTPARAQAPAPALLKRLRPMVARDTGESHRASTPLELLFDLCFVVAVSQAARELNDDLVAHHVGSGVVGYLTVFFAIWWAWVNFTWFASAYDVDDVAYRLITFVQIVGVLILAAGVPAAFNSGNFAIITVGYVVMRVAMVTQWLRAAAGDPVGRPAALRYALAISILQIGWVARLWLPHYWGEVAFYVLAAAEMAVPAWAERGGHGSPWHPEHISERYGLFTLIVLGECVAAATLAIQAAATSAQGLSASLVGVAGGGVVLVFALWWWYFEHPAHEALRLSRSLAFIWGYGHYVVFASLAALGAGLGVAAESTHRGGGGLTVIAGLAVAIPISAFLLVTAALHVRLNLATAFRAQYVIPFVIALLALGWGAGGLGIGFTVPVMALVVTALVLLESVLRRRHIPA
jgi:low temperature requirement protein LtrA